jgi:hypothetical protein
MMGYAPFQAAHEALDAPARACRACGCTENRACVADGEACGWAEQDLCTACVEILDGPPPENPA